MTASNVARARNANADSSTDEANVGQKNNKQCGCGYVLETVANKKTIWETTNGRMSWSHDILSPPGVAVKHWTTLCKLGHFIYCHVLVLRRTMRIPHDTSAWDVKGGHATNDTHASNVTARRDREFQKEVARLKADADGVELVALPKNPKSQASLCTLFNKQTSKQTSSSTRLGLSVGGSVAMTT